MASVATTQSFEGAIYGGLPLKAWIPAVVDDLVEAVDSVQIFIFGSVARGEDAQGSDLDILVVFDKIEDGEWLLLGSRATGAITTHIPYDLLVTDLKRFEYNKQRPWHPEHDAGVHGLLVYSREPRIAKELYINPPTPSPAEDATLWFERAKRDMAVAERERPFDQDAALFHAQQAGEKSIKALLVSGGGEFKHTHDLCELINQLPDQHRARFTAELPNENTLNWLTHWAVGGRYELSPSNELTDNDAALLFAVADRIVDAATAAIGLEPPTI